MRLENTDTVYCLTQLCHDGLTHQAHPGAGGGVEVVAGTTGGRVVRQPESVTPEPVPGVSEQLPGSNYVVHDGLPG